MAIQLTTTRKAAAFNGIKCLVYAGAGAGKTRLCATTGGNPIIISAEGGLLSLRDTDIPVIVVSNMGDVEEAYSFLLSEEGLQYDWVCLDSISEIAEKVLSDEKAGNKDPRKAYGALQDRMFDFIRAFRDLPGRNVYMSAKMERVKDEATGITSYQPSMPGNKLGQSLPFFFDLVFALRVEKDEEGTVYRVLQTGRDAQYEAKDRSGALDMWEAPDLSSIAAKIRGDQGAAPSPVPTEQAKPEPEAAQADQPPEDEPELALAQGQDEPPVTNSKPWKKK